MRFPTFLILLFFCANSYSDCFDTHGRYTDSKSYQMNVSEIVKSDNLKKMSSYAITQVFAQNNCSDYKVSYLECGKALKNIDETEICYAKTQYGYFIISKDMLENLNIIFNRWD